MTRVLKLRNGLSLLDLDFQGRLGVIGAYLLEDDGEYALLEVGPTSTLDALLEGIEATEIRPDAIKNVLVTHVHLDHAGAAGSLVQRFPQVKVYVHERGAPHLEDPTKLLASATRIYGDRMDSLWGEVVPVPAKNLVSLTDGDRVRVGRLELSALYTPGHASHHVAYFDEAHAEIFTGDVAAIRLQGFDYIRPATPPPDVDLVLWVASLERVRASGARRLYLTHFGPFGDVERHLRVTREQLMAWADFVEQLVADGYDTEYLRTALRRRADDEVLQAAGATRAVQRYELAAPAEMSVDGYLRYFRKRADAGR